MEGLLSSNVLIHLKKNSYREIKFLFCESCLWNNLYTKTINIDTTLSLVDTRIFIVGMNIKI